MTEKIREEKIKEIQIHDEENIKGFFGEYRFLSNFYPAKVLYMGTLFPSVEHAYQAAKFSKERHDEFLEISAEEAKELGSNAPNFSSGEWDSVSLGIMKYLVSYKFLNNEDMRVKLGNTGEKYLEETNYWGDTFWGVSGGQGENQLGEILMDIRSIVRVCNNHEK